MPIPMQDGSLQRLSAKDVVYQSLCDWIVTGVLQPGEKLLDGELATYFQVSRTPVREAFQMLSAQRLITIAPGRSTVVTEIDMADIETCYVPLASLQGLAAKLASKEVTTSQLSQLEAIQNEFCNACQQHLVDEAIAADALFHQTILKWAKNPYIEEFSQTLILHIQRIKYHYFRTDRLRLISVEHHAGILQALLDGDGEKAGDLMQAHWLYVMERCLVDVAQSFKSGQEDTKGGLSE